MCDEAAMTFRVLVLGASVMANEQVSVNYRVESERDPIEFVLRLPKGSTIKVGGKYDVELREVK